MPTRSRSVLALCLCAPACGAFAAGFNETETNGTSFNNTRGTAQFISSGFFTPNAGLDVFGALPTASVAGHLGGNDVDFFSFTTGGGTSYFSTTRTTGGIDTYIGLFSSNGTLLGDNDDSTPIGPGANAMDSFLGSMNLASGTYFIAITSNKNSALASFSGSIFTELARPDGGFGGFAFGDADSGIDSFLHNGDQLEGGEYTLNITIPSPGVFAFAACSALTFGARRRRA
ncbi:MAG: DVUA0089 family protein [Phycisphaerales bacterium]